LGRRCSLDRSGGNGDAIVIVSTTGYNCFFFFRLVRCLYVGMRSHECARTAMFHMHVGIDCKNHRRPIKEHGRHGPNDRSTGSCFALLSCSVFRKHVPVAHVAFHSRPMYSGIYGSWQSLRKARYMSALFRDENIGGCSSEVRNLLLN
jgi:hypothetical protein